MTQSSIDPNQIAAPSNVSGRRLDIVAAGLIPVLVGGFIEAAIAIVKVEWLKHLAFVGSEAVWMAPLSAVLLAGIPSMLVGFAVASRRGGEAGVRVALILSLGAALFGLTVPASAIHWAAWAIVSLGVATRLVSLVDAPLPPAPRGALPTGVLAFGIAFFVSGSPVLQGTPAHTPAQSSPDDGAPNVLLIFLDTVRASNLGVYGYARPTTPFLDRWAEREAIVYETAVSPSSWTLASHASAFTGQPANALSVTWNRPLSTRYPTLAEEMSRMGYRTAGFVANVEYCSAETGLARGFQHYDGYQRSPSRILVTSNLGAQAYRLLSKYGNRYLQGLLGFVDLPGRKLAGPTIDAALEWIGRSEGEPFFGFLNLYDAHAPYNPPGLESYLERVAATPGAPAYPEGSPIASYDGGISYMDQEIERLFDELSRADVLENTLVIITSDHGEEFGEHGLFGHGDSLFWPSIHVPLIVRLPGGRDGGKRRSGPVSLTEIPSFVLTQLAPGAAHAFPILESSLSRAQDTSDIVFSSLRAGSNHIAGAPIARGDMYSLVTPDLHYVRYGDGAEEVYRYRLDPDEQRDVGETEAVALRSRLSRFVGQNQDDWIGANENLRWRVPERQSFPSTPPARVPRR